MCRRVTCGTCGKPTFAGCGMHIEQVLGDVPRDQRCRCREQPAGKAGEKTEATSGASWLRGLFGGK